MPADVELSHERGIGWQLAPNRVVTGRDAFAKELKEGRLVWRPVNVEEKGNEHFMKDYKLYTKSLVIVDLVDGAQVRWKNLERIWELLRDDGAFRQYVQGEVRSYLEKRS